MSTARQAAQKIADRWVGPVTSMPNITDIIQEAIDTATAELKAKYYRSLEDITRERDEATNLSQTEVLSDRPMRSEGLRALALAGQRGRWDVSELMNELTDAEIDELLERFDQTGPALQRRIIARLIADKASAPAWHRRPTSPGWWILKWNDGNYRIMHFREHELKSIAGWVMRCYGPIPEPPEPTP